MGITPVQKGQKLTAQAWNQLATTVNNITSGTMRGAASGRTVPCTIKNHTSVSVPAGNVLTVYLAGCVRLAQYTPDEARAAWMNNGFQLDGYAALPSNSGTIGVPALLIDGIAAGGIGRCMIPNLCAGFLTYTESSLPETCTFNELSGAFESATSGIGDWMIIAASSAVNSRVFCYLVPSGGGTLTATYYDSNGSSWSRGVSEVIFSRYHFQGSVDPNDSSILTLTVPQYTLSGATSPVTNVTVDSNGDIVLTREPITLTKSF